MDKYIQKFNCENSKKIQEYYNKRLKYQINFIQTQKTYFDYKKVCDISETDQELQLFFGNTGLNEFSSMRDIIVKLSEVGLRVNDIAQLFKIHKRAIVDSIDNKWLSINDNNLIDNKFKEDVAKLVEKRKQMLKFRAEFDKKHNILANEIKELATKIEKKAAKIDKNDLEISVNDIKIKKKTGWITAGKKVKASVAISKLESYIGKEELLRNKEKLGLEYGQYVQIDTQWYDRKTREELKKEEKNAKK